MSNPSERFLGESDAHYFDRLHGVHEPASSPPSETPEEMIRRKAEAFDQARTLFLADDVSVLNTFIVRDPESLSEEEQVRQAKLIAIQGSIAILLDWGSNGVKEAAMSRPTETEKK